MDHFSSLGAECIIGRERHEDGGIHLHVFVDFGRRFRSRRTDVFDVDGFHPNVSPSRGTPDEGYDYAIKDGEVVCGGLGKPDPITRRAGDSKTDTKWAEITSATCREEFWSLCHELDPKSTACNFNSLQKYAEWKFAEVPAVYESPYGASSFEGGLDGRDDWLQQSGIGCGETLLGMSWETSVAAVGVSVLGQVPPSLGRSSLSPVGPKTDLSR